MTQKAIDEAEWNDPTNWRGGWLGIYYSERDSRAWVPKRNPALGATLNFARRSGVLTLLLILAMALATTLLALFGLQILGS